MDFVVPFIQPQQRHVKGDRASWVLILFTSCSQKGFPSTFYTHLLLTTLVHRTLLSDLALLQWCAQSRWDNTSALVASPLVILKWIGKDFLFLHIPCCAVPAFCLPGHTAPQSLVLEGKKDLLRHGWLEEEEVLHFNRWAWNRLSYNWAGEKRLVFFSWLFLPPLICPAGLSTVLPCFHP